MSSETTIDSREMSENLVTVSIAGELDEYGIRQIKDTFDGVTTTHGARTILVDLSKVTFAGSAAIALFVATARQVRYKNGKLVLAGATPVVAEVFDLIGLGELIRLYPSIDDAVTALS